MSEELVNRIKRGAQCLFSEYGFNSILINDEVVYERMGKYRKFTFVTGLHGFVIEYAESLDEAQRNVYEDGDLYPISLGVGSLICLLRDDIEKYLIDA